MSRICRTCLSEIRSKHYIDLQRFPFAKKQLMLCIPELDFDIVFDSIICMTCARALYAAYKFKCCCLRTEQRIHSYIQMLTSQQDNLELVPGNNDNTINLTGMFLVQDLKNDYNAADNHLKTGCNLEDVKEEDMSDVTDENCDDVEENCESIKEESTEIEETELDDFIKSEVLDSCSDTGIKFSLEQWSQFEPILVKLDISENIPNNNDSDKCEATNSMEVQHGIDCFESKANVKENDVSSGIKMEFEGQSSITVMQSEGLEDQYSKSDYGKYVVNIESSNAAVICAQSCSKQDNSVTKTPEMVYRLESKHSFSTATWQCKINGRRIAETSNNNSLKEIVKHKSTTKSHSENDGRRPYRLHKNKKNSNEQIVGTSVLHNDSLRHSKEILTEMDGSSARKIDGNNYPNYLKCGTSDLNVNIENNTLHPKPRDISALLISNTFNEVSARHSNSFSAQVNNYDFLDTIIEKPYKCNICDYASSRKNELKIHVRIHTGERPYKCNSCDYTSSRKSDLTVHVGNHAVEKPYKCNVCDYASVKKGNLKRHMAHHTGEKPYKCNSCDYASHTKNELKVHAMIHTGEKPYKCNVCDYASRTKNELKIHVRIHTGERPYKCNFCDYTSSRKSDLRVHVGNHAAEKPYKCNVCNYASVKKGNLKGHMAKHTEEKPYKCNLCDYASCMKNKLKIHVMIHTGEKPYKCNVCDYASRTKNELKIHVRIHTGERPYKCNVCDYTSNRKDLLKVHVRHHTGEKPYKCNVCDYASRAKNKLKIHVRIHTGEKPYKCNSCDYASCRKNDLKIHVRSHTGEKPYKCTSCDYASCGKSNLKIHVKKHTAEKPL